MAESVRRGSRDDHAEPARPHDEPFQLNPDMIVTVESTPDTVITLATGAKIVVAETPEEVKPRPSGLPGRSAGRRVATPSLLSARRAHRRFAAPVGGRGPSAMLSLGLSKGALKSDALCTASGQD